MQIIEEHSSKPLRIVTGGTLLTLKTQNWNTPHIFIWDTTGKGCETDFRFCHNYLVTDTAFDNDDTSMSFYGIISSVDEVFQLHLIFLSTPH